jgi:multidrug efflux pump subunit AcrA (membrane-fusion protein)
MKRLQLVVCGLILGVLAVYELASPAADAHAALAQPGPRAPLEVPGRTRCILSRRGIIAAPILRPVVAVLVGPGDRVTKGQVLIKLFDLEPQAKVRAREQELIAGDRGTIVETT